jgi:hypothetical protein
MPRASDLRQGLGQGPQVGLHLVTLPVGGSRRRGVKSKRDKKDCAM